MKALLLMIIIALCGCSDIKVEKGEVYYRASWYGVCSREGRDLLKPFTWYHVDQQPYRKTFEKKEVNNDTR